MKFTVNGKEYNAAPFDFNAVCDLEDAGFSMDEFGAKQMKAMRAYFALSSGLSVQEAGREMNTHVVNGGTLGSLAEAMGKELDKSDFFRALKEGANTEDSANQEAESKEAPEGKN